MSDDTDVAQPSRPPVPRLAARVILVDGEQRVLLFRAGDPTRPERGTWWFTPGGAADPGESIEDAARRELFEETGVQVNDLGPVVLTRRFLLEWGDSCYDQSEAYFLLVLDRPHAVLEDGWTDLEREVVVEHRWFTLAELVAATEPVYPEGLAGLVAGWLKRDAAPAPSGQPGAGP